MTKHVWACLAVVATVLFLSGVAWAEPQGTEKNPYKTRGPMGKWVTNGKWTMRVTRVQFVEDYAAFEKLPWTKRFTESKRKTLLPYFARQLAKEQDQKLALVTVEAINLTGGKSEVGAKAPIWCIRCDDGVESRVGATSGRKFKSVTHRDGESVRQVSWFIEGGMPESDKVNPKGRTGGVIAVFIPSYAEPKQFFFRWGGQNDSSWGKDESLVIDFGKK